MFEPARLLLLCCSLAVVGGCGSQAIGDGDGESETGASDAAELAWVYQPSGCGHAYGVVHRGRDTIVVGAIDGAPWIARIDEDGTIVWERQQPRSGAYFAIDADTDVGTLIAAGRYDGMDGEHGLVDVHDDAGELLSSFEAIGDPGSGIYGVARIDGGYVVTGVLDGFDMLLGLVSAIDGTLTPWPAPTGFGLAASIGFGVRADAAGGVAACGRASAGEGGRAWIGRFDANGTELWTTLGEDPGVGAFMECWGVAAGVDGDVFVAEYGYTGARLAGYVRDDGALIWEASEPSTATQAIDVGRDGTIYVGGWSADASADPFRSHEIGERSGWLAAFDSAGTLLWRTQAAMPLSIFALRVHEDGFVTVVGDLEPDSDCSRPWVGRFEL